MKARILPLPKRRNRLLLLLAMLTGWTGFLAACNTVEGAGKDIERGGEKLQDAADRHK